MKSFGQFCHQKCNEPTDDYLSLVNCFEVEEEILGTAGHVLDFDYYHLVSDQVFGHLMKLFELADFVHQHLLLKLLLELKKDVHYILMLKAKMPLKKIKYFQLFIFCSQLSASHLKIDFVYRYLIGCSFFGDTDFKLCNI